MNKNFNNALDNAQAYLNICDDRSPEADNYREEMLISDDTDELEHCRHLLAELVAATGRFCKWCSEAESCPEHKI